MRCGLTQDQAAQVTGIAKRTQANYEAGSSDAPALYLSKAARLLEFDVLYILNGVRTMLDAEALTPVEDMIVKQYRTIPEFDQQAVRRFLQAMADDARAKEK